MNVNLNPGTVVGTAHSPKVIESLRKDPPNEPRSWNANAPINELLGTNKTHTVDDSYFGVTDTHNFAIGGKSDAIQEISQPSASVLPVFKFACDIIDATLKVVDHAASLLVTPHAVADIDDIAHLTALEKQISGFLNSAEQTTLWLTNAVMQDALISPNPQVLQSRMNFVNQTIWNFVRTVQNNKVANPETRDTASPFSKTDTLAARPRSTDGTQRRNPIDSLRVKARAVDSGKNGNPAFVPVNLIVLAYRLSHIRARLDTIGNVPPTEPTHTFSEPAFDTNTNNTRRKQSSATGIPDA